MNVAQLSAIIQLLDHNAGTKSRQAVRALERYIRAGWEEDLHAYRDWQTEAFVLLWRLARIKEIAGAAGLREQEERYLVPGDVAQRIEALQDAQPTWEGNSFERLQALWGTPPIRCPITRELLGLPVGKPCPSCNGMPHRPCGKCNGEGFVV